jgi:hypothetical protein
VTFPKIGRGVMTAEKRDFVKCRGRPAGWGRSLVEDALTLPIALLRREGALTPGYTGTLRWTGAGSATVSVSPTCLMVTPDIQSASTYYIQLARRPCKLGGFEQLMECPRCRRSCRTLYRDPRGFVCRICADLRYESQRLGREYRLYRRARSTAVSAGDS